MTNPQDPAMIEALVAEFQASGLRELHVRTDDFELYLSNDPGTSAGSSASARPAPPAAAPAAAPAVAGAPPPVPEAAAAALPPGTVAVQAPYLGSFYRSPKPGAPAYVEVGSRVEPDTELCLVEVMKLFTSVRAGVAGTVEAILATDGQMVEAGAPLFAIRAA